MSLWSVLSNDLAKLFHLHKVNEMFSPNNGDHSCDNESHDRSKSNVSEDIKDRVFLAERKKKVVEHIYSVYLIVDHYSELSGFM